MRKHLLLMVCLLGWAISTLSAQPAATDHTVYLIGNTAATAIPPAHLAALQQEISRLTHPFTIIHLGDVAANGGLAQEPDEAAREKLDQLLALVRNSPNGRIYFLPGDKDWANSGEEGLKAVKRLEQYIKDKLPYKNAFLPGKGCPGPVTIDLAPHVRMVALNTPWWMHPHDKPEAPDTDCKLLTRKEVMEELQGLLEDSDQQNVLVVGHHPVLSSGTYGGRIPLRRHLFPFSDHNPGNRVPLPVLGSIYASFRQNVGTVRDMASPGYQAFQHDMLTALKLNTGVVYAAAHDYSLQLHAFEDNYYLVSGSFAEKEGVGKLRSTKYKKAATGFSALDYGADGSVHCRFLTFEGNGLKEAKDLTLFAPACGGEAPKGVPRNERYVPCRVQPELQPLSEGAYPEGMVSTVAGPRYAATFPKRVMFGGLYRDSWTRPVQVPYLHLDTAKSGLTPFARGGGRQTKALKMKGRDGHEYVFRSIDKDAVKALPPELRNTFFKDVIREVTATAQPYGVLVARSLLDSTDILHPRPYLYVLPDHPSLGPFREEYKGLLGTLEERPLDATDSLEGFGGSRDVMRSYKLYRRLYQDNDNRVDPMAFAKARAFDMWVGDFGRHEDNWKWAGYKDKGSWSFLPIPRDRDHVFSRWNGLLPWLADREWAVPSIENFDDEFHDLRSLNWPARHLDRLLLTSLTRQDWQEVARYLQSRMTDRTIDSAIAELPPAVRNAQGKDISRKLKSRIKELPQALDAYYELLSREVDVVGSNKNEYFLVQRLPEGNVRVQVYKKDKDTDLPKGEPFFDRTFVRGETKEIRLYALDGKDVVRIEGQVPHSIQVRVIGGPGQDAVTDASRVKGFRSYTRVYDNPGTELQVTPYTHVMLREGPAINRYDREAFEYNTYMPALSVLYNRSDGVGLGAGVTFKNQGFRKEGFSSIYNIALRGTSNGNRQLTVNGLWHHVLGRWDVAGEASYGHFFPFYNFFGIGNNTVKVDSLFDDTDYYGARYRGFRSELGLQHTFWTKSTFNTSLLFEDYRSNIKEGSVLQAEDRPENRQVSAAPQTLGGLMAELDIDFRDRQVSVRRGFRLYARHQSYQKLDDQPDKRFGLTQAFGEYYATVNLLLPITLGVKVGGAQNYGERLPFYKYATLGLRDNLRGYVRNRFTGDRSAYLNSELRFHLGQVRTPVLPFYVGLLAFYDRGRVWFNDASPGGWHEGYGGGFFIAPVAERFTLSVTLQHSVEENLLIQFGAGFRLDL